MVQNSYFESSQSPNAMKLPDFLLVGKTLAPNDLSDFTVQNEKKSLDRLRVFAWLSFVLYVLLLYLDVQRKEDGVFYQHTIYRYLEYIHFSGILFLIPAVSLSVWKRDIADHKSYRAVLIYGSFFIFIITIFAMGVASYYESGNIVLYTGFILVTNWTFPLNHVQRLIFNILCVSAMILLVIFPIQVLSHYIPENLHIFRLVTIYEVVGLTIVAYILDTFDFNLRLEKFLYEKQLEREKQHVVDLERAKSHLYTNLTHEFRTPLTVISGMTEQINLHPDKWTKRGTEMIQRNTKRMLNLVNQILDLNKLESGHMPVHRIHGDIVPYLAYITNSFATHAESKGITIHLIVDDPVIELDYDPEKALNIASNIISNAINHTPEGGNIYVRLAIIEKSGAPWIELKVKDTGAGISEEQLPHIFDRFYQAENNPSFERKGSGIGLAMVQQLTDLMNGEIEVKSQLDEGTEFTLRFAIKHNAEERDVKISQSSVMDVVTGFVKPTLEKSDLDVIDEHMLEDVPNLLIVENDDDVTQYIQSCIGEDYNTFVARDGVEGISKAKELVPDIIISDIVMPKKDGFELCREVKSDEITSHIPVVLLTARASVDSKLEGLDSGADDYIVKPFNPDELKMRLRNLIRVRRIIQQRYKDAGDGSFDTHASENREDIFIKNVRKVILDRLDDNEYSIAQLCRELGLSRTQLHNKLKAVTGRSTSLFIRYIRLSESKKLLKAGQLNVSEVAYSVGFKDPSYFSRTFAEEFGYPPSKLLP